MYTCSKQVYQRLNQFLERLNHSKWVLQTRIQEITQYWQCIDNYNWLCWRLDPSFYCYCITSLPPLSAPPPCLPPAQSHREVNRTPVWRLLFQGVIYCGHGCCSARPGSPHAARGSVVPGPGRLSARALGRLRRSPPTTRLPAAHARAHSVCGRHHRQGGPHHQECHQTDAVQVSYSDEDSRFRSRLVPAGFINFSDSSALSLN